MKIELTENQMKALSSFLSRVQLQGAEVPAFNDLLNALGKPAVEEKKEKK